MTAGLASHIVEIVRSRGFLTISIAVVSVGLALAVLTTDAPAASSIRPAPGTPDPKLMVLTSSDLGGAKVTKQGYYKDADFPSLISYSREFEDGTSGSTALPYVGSEAEVGTSALTTTRFVSTLRRFLGTKKGRALLTKSFDQELGAFASNVQVGRPRNLGIGAGSFDLLITMRLLGLRIEAHFAAFSVERVLGGLITVGEPGRRVPLSVMRRLAKIMAARMTVQLAPTNSALPTISGTPVVGQTLTATAGTWSGSPASFAYQWQRCDTAGANCASIAGAVSQSYMVVDPDIGSTLRVSVVAQNAAGSATAVSAATSVVPAVGAPSNTSLPTISGTAQIGQTLTAGTGIWAGSPTSFGFQWQRCNASGTSCADIPGAMSGTYVLAAADTGATIRVVVTATNSLGAGSAESAPTPVVT